VTGLGIRDRLDEIRERADNDDTLYLLGLVDGLMARLGQDGGVRARCTCWKTGQYLNPIIHNDVCPVHRTWTSTTTNFAAQSRKASEMMEDLHKTAEGDLREAGFDVTSFGDTMIVEGGKK
jgi:hypothetical protein